MANLKGSNNSSLSSENDPSPADGQARQPAGLVNWREALPEEYRTMAEKFTSPADVVKSYAELQRKLGSAINPLAEDASEEHIDEFYTRLGRPATADGYDLKRPELPDGLEYSEELEKAGRTWFHKAGLNNTQAAILFGGFNEFALAVAEQRVNADKEAVAEATTALRREWGADYDKNLDYAERAFQEYFGADKGTMRVLTLADGTPIGSHPLFVKALARIGRTTGEHELHVGAPDDQTRQTLEERLKELQNRGDYWTNPAVQAEVRDINDRLYGTAPADQPT